MKPTPYLTNWSSHRTPGCHGPGRKLTIMAAPRHWEKGEGCVGALVPNLDDLRDVKAARITVDEYRERFNAALDGRKLNLFPLSLTIDPPDNRTLPMSGLPLWIPQLVESGDTLCCACSRAEAAAGRCHRVWAAHALAAAGWNIILDGEPLEP